MRVLVINKQNIFSENATGITLRSLLLNNREIELFDLSFSPVVAEYNGVQCANIKTLIKPPQKKGLTNSINSNLKQKRGLSIIRQNIVLINDMILFNINKKVVNKIKEFSPEIIYTLGGSICVLKTCLKFSKKFNIPIVTHFMDNWTESLQWKPSLISILYFKRLNILLKKTLSRSFENICISDLMSENYSKKFNCSFKTLMNSVSIDDYSHPIIREKIKKIIYAGGLHLGREKSLLDIACVIKEMDNVFLEIYSKDIDSNIRNLFKDLPVIFYEPIPHKEVPKLLQNADLLVHVESINSNISTYFKYSISTKIPEYLCSGVPILFYGPQEIACYNYLLENDCAFLASNLSELKNSIEKAKNQIVRRNISKNAIMLAKTNHDLVKNQKILVDVFKENIRRSKKDG